MTDEIKKPVFKAPSKPIELPKMVIPQVQTKTAPLPQAPAAVAKPMPAPSSPQTMPKQTTITQQTQVEGKTVQAEIKQTVPNADVYAKNFAADLNLPPKVLETKIMGAILAGLFFFGMMMGCVMFSGGKPQTVQGLDGIVANPDVRNKAGLRRCGTTDPNRECVLFIMNAKTFDRLGSDFYQEAQNVTGVPKYSIQLSNLQYANALIRPGYIAQIYLPARQ